MDTTFQLNHIQNRNIPFEISMSNGHYMLFKMFFYFIFYILLLFFLKRKNKRKKKKADDHTLDIRKQHIEVQNYIQRKGE